VHPRSAFSPEKPWRGSRAVAPAQVHLIGCERPLTQSVSDFTVAIIRCRRRWLTRSCQRPAVRTAVSSTTHGIRGCACRLDPDRLAVVVSCLERHPDTDRVAAGTEVPGRVASDVRQVVTIGLFRPRFGHRLIGTVGARVFDRAGQGSRPPPRSVG